jgi:probable HAF family extracellular repeat protein
MTTTSRSSPRRMLCLFGTGLALSLLTLSAQTGYVSFDFPGAVSTSASGINNRGDIVGWYLGTDGRDHGFLLSADQFTTIDPPDSIRARAFGINDRGDVVGVYRTVDLADHGFLLSGGTFSTIDGPSAEETFAFSINDRGEIVGGFEGEDGEHAFLLTDAGLEMIEVPVEGAETPAANGINAPGHIVGRYLTPPSRSHGFLMTKQADKGEGDDKAFTSIDFPGATFTTAVGVNDRREIVGSYLIGTPSTRHGFLFYGGTYTSVDVPGATFTNARGINAPGDIVGEYRDAGGQVHGFLLRRQP